MGAGNFLAAAGGLTLFLYGIRLMEKGFAGAFGKDLERILEKWTDTPGKAMLAGAGITALLQSSSVTTVMVVGFADVGLLDLYRAACVIMGANIGTTVTAWILEMPRIKNKFFFLILAMCGVCLRIWGDLSERESALEKSSGKSLEKSCGKNFGKREKCRNVGDGLTGFGMLFFGMAVMSGEMKSLAERMGLARRLIGLSDPSVALAVGLLLTALIQSSSASVGILQALCGTGAVSLKMAVPFVMGQNIGTCATALLSAAGSGENAKRAALLHLYFNGIAAGLFLILYAAGRAFLPEMIWVRPVDGRGVALIHSMFNIGAVAVLLPRTEQLVGLVCRPCALRR